MDKTKLKKARNGQSKINSKNKTKAKHNSGLKTGKTSVKNINLSLH
jgi:hypothetical protein